jgi:hypothetical protein
LALCLVVSSPNLKYLMRSIRAIDAPFDLYGLAKRVNRCRMRRC